MLDYGGTQCSQARYGKAPLPQVFIYDENLILHRESADDKYNRACGTSWVDHQPIDCLVRLYMSVIFSYT